MAFVQVKTFSKALHKKTDIQVILPTPLASEVMDGAMARETTPCPAVDGEAASSQGVSGRGPSRAAASDEPAAADAAAVGRGGRPVDPRGVEGGR